MSHTLPGPPPAAQACPQCGGVGLVLTGPNTSARCPCQLRAGIDARLRKADFPEAFAGATLDSYQATGGNARARLAAQAYVEDFIPGHTERGLLLTGPVGTGKTHLGIAMARWLTEKKAVTARFVQMNLLFDRLRASFDVASTDSRDLAWAPILRADLVIVDELGAAKATDFVFETQEILIGHLYNSATAVIVTTNLANMAAGAGIDSANPYARAARPDTLGDRIGARMFSRLQQMCAAIELEGADWRARKR